MHDFLPVLEAVHFELFVVEQMPCFLLVTQVGGHAHYCEVMIPRVENDRLQLIHCLEDGFILHVLWRVKIGNETLPRERRHDHERVRRCSVLGHPREVECQKAGERLLQHVLELERLLLAAFFGTLDNAQLFRSHLEDLEELATNKLDLRQVVLLVTIPGLLLDVLVLLRYEFKEGVHDAELRVHVRGYLLVLDALAVGPAADSALADRQRAGIVQLLTVFKVLVVLPQNQLEGF